MRVTFQEVQQRPAKLRKTLRKCTEAITPASPVRSRAGALSQSKTHTAKKETASGAAESIEEAVDQQSEEDPKDGRRH